MKINNKFIESKFNNNYGLIHTNINYPFYIYLYNKNFKIRSRFALLNSLILKKNSKILTF